MSSPAGLLSLLLAGLLLESQSLAADPPIAATVCELKATPAKYAGRLVIVRAEAVLGIHANGLMDRTCSESILLSEPRDGAEARDPARWRGQFACGHGLEHERLMPESLHWSDLPGPPIPVKRADGDESQRFYDALGDHEADRSCVRRNVTATVVGRFDHEACQIIWVRDGPTSPPRSYPAGFGAYRATPFRLVIQSINDVALGPENDCWRNAGIKRNPAGLR